MTSAKTYAQHMLSLKQIRALPDFNDLPQAEILRRAGEVAAA